MHKQLETDPAGLWLAMPLELTVSGFAAAQDEVEEAAGGNDTTSSSSSSSDEESECPLSAHRTAVGKAARGAKRQRAGVRMRGGKVRTAGRQR